MVVLPAQSYSAGPVFCRMGREELRGRHLEMVLQKFGGRIDAADQYYFYTNMLLDGEVAFAPLLVPL